MVRAPPANGLPKKAAWYADGRFLVVSAPFLLARQKKLPATQATHSVLRLQFAHPNRLGTSQVTPDTNLIAIQFFTVFSVSSLHPPRSRKVWQPGKNETEELKFCSKFTNIQTILAYPKLRLDRWNLKNKENITIIAIICQKNLPFAIIVENWELKLLHYKHTGYQWYFSSMEVYPPLTSASPKIKVRVDCDCDQSPKTNHLKFFHNNESCQSKFYAINEFYLVFH